VTSQIKITTDKFIIPTNGKQKDLIEENDYNKKKKILEIIKTLQKRDLTLYGKLMELK
jgi:Txe/YoeB family toxin of Txe-Axe toxin-antitoxin module